jgi:hypothetical protein
MQHSCSRERWLCARTCAPREMIYGVVRIVLALLTGIVVGVGVGWVVSARPFSGPTQQDAEREVARTSGTGHAYCIPRDDAEKSWDCTALRLSSTGADLVFPNRCDPDASWVVTRSDGRVHAKGLFIIKVLV